MAAPAIRQAEVMTVRTLVLVRHAKADPPTDVGDFDRPLTARGHADAAAAGAWLFRRGHRPQLVICSPARRTRQTWHAIAVALSDSGVQAPPVQYVPEIYEGDTEEILGILRKTPDTVGTLAVVGHNPTVSLLAALLDPAAHADSDGLRTCGIAVHEVATGWADLETATLRDSHTARG